MRSARWSARPPMSSTAGITWKHPTADASATVLFNRVGERITEAGEVPLPDVVEQPRNMLDASVTFPLFGTLAARVDGKNLLDAPVQTDPGGCGPRRLPEWTGVFDRLQLAPVATRPSRPCYRPVTVGSQDTDATSLDSGLDASVFFSRLSSPTIHDGAVDDVAIRPAVPGSGHSGARWGVGLFQ